MVNLLLIGVDSDNKPAAPLPYGSDNQADVILVAALDTDANRMTLISVSRDTMCDIAVLDQNGQVSGAAHTQLALSYSNGDGLYESCRLCQEAVSQLFYGLQFDGCAAFYMGGIGRLNDAVGGVTVSVLDDYPFTDVPDGWNMYPGQDVTLTGAAGAAVYPGPPGRCHRQRGPHEAAEAVYAGPDQPGQGPGGGQPRQRRSSV